MDPLRYQILTMDKETFLSKRQKNMILYEQSVMMETSLPGKKSGQITSNLSTDKNTTKIESNTSTPSSSISSSPNPSHPNSPSTQSLSSSIPSSPVESNTNSPSTRTSNLSEAEEEEEEDENPKYFSFGYYNNNNRQVKNIKNNERIDGNEIIGETRGGSSKNSESLDCCSRNTPDDQEDSESMSHERNCNNECIIL